VWIDVGDLAYSRRARDLYADRHEAEERRVIENRLRPEDVVLELGSGMGIVTVTCCQIAGSERVFTFEANPRMEQPLRHQFSINGVTPQLNMAMVASEDGTAEFHVSEKFLISSRFESATRVSRAAVTRTTVPTVSLPRLLHELRPTFLVVDIEGGELELMHPAVDLASVERICIEVHPQIIGDDKAGELVAHLIQQGFRLSLEWSQGIVLYFERVVPAGSARIAA
jgi:FkbM family methyltransferase